MYYIHICIHTFTYIIHTQTELTDSTHKQRGASRQVCEDLGHVGQHSKILCCSVLHVVQCGAVWCSVVQCGAVCCSVVQCVAVWCSVLQCVAVCCSVLQCAAVCCSVMQCVAVCCSVMQCAAVCCSVLQGQWLIYIYTYTHIFLYT